MTTCKSAGIDKISIKLIKAAGRTILNSLKNIFNLSLNTGIFPDDWKTVRVTPIFKSDNKTDCGNYKPISIISNVAQIFEKAVYNQLITFLNKNQVIDKNQSGFLTFDKNYLITTNYLANMDKGLICGLVFYRF